MMHLDISELISASKALVFPDSRTHLVLLLRFPEALRSKGFAPRHPAGRFQHPQLTAPSLEGASPGAGTQSPMALKLDQLLFCQDVWEKPPRLLLPDMDRSPVSWRLVSPPYPWSTTPAQAASASIPLLPCCPG